jgi:hypothetical protein
MSAVSAAKAVVVPEQLDRSVRLRPDADASVVRRRVEELVRGLEELEEDEEGSDSSSDLFELECLRGADVRHDQPRGQPRHRSESSLLRHLLPKKKKEL